VTPAVSVCIPAYNYGRFLARAIDSVLAQDYRDFELIVVDNASEDDTPAVLARYGERIQAHRNERNVGLFGNFARCLELARGEHVKFLAADDWLHPAYLVEAVALMDRHPGAAIVSGPGFFVDGDGRVYGMGTTGVFEPGLVRGDVALRAQADLLNVIGMPSNTLLRRAAVDAAGGFDARFAPAADVHLWGKLLARHDLAWLAQPRCYLRIHAAKAHDYGLDPSESTFLAWEALGREVGPPIDPPLVARAVDAEAERSLLYVVAHLLAGRPAAARRILAFTSRHVSWPRVLARFAVRLPALVRAQLARILAVRRGRMVVYAPRARMGPPVRPPGPDGA
jgi:glycosyltransferase involved in cell wall biosynthesis